MPPVKEAVAWDRVFSLSGILALHWGHLSTETDWFLLLVAVILGECQKQSLFRAAPCGKRDSGSYPVDRIYFDFLFLRRSANDLCLDLRFLVFDPFWITSRRICLLCFRIVKRKPVSSLTLACIFSISFRYQSLFLFRSDKRCFWRLITRIPLVSSLSKVSGFGNSCSKL